MFAAACATRLLVDVDLVPMLCRERAGVAGRLREADQHQRDGGNRRRARVVPHQCGVRNRRTTAVREARRRPGRRRDPEVEQVRRQEPADDQDECAGHPRRDDPQPEHHDQRDDPEHHGRRCASPSDPSQDRSSWNEFEPLTSVPVILGSSPMTTSIAAPNRKPVTTARDRNCASQPIRRTARTRNSRPDARVMPGDERRHVGLVGDSGGRHRARRHRGEPGARAHRDLPTGTEDRVEDGAGGGRVQTVLERDAGDAGVPEVLRARSAPPPSRRRSGRREASPTVRPQPADDRQPPDKPAGRTAGRAPVRHRSRRLLGEYLRLLRGELLLGQDTSGV